jgi:hypothetical protein
MHIIVERSAAVDDDDYDYEYDYDNSWSYHLKIVYR